MKKAFFRPRPPVVPSREPRAHQTVLVAPQQRPLARNAVLALLAACAVMSACSGHLKVGPGWEGETVTAEGMVPYDAKDVSATKASALAAAQRHAVEQVVGVFVSGQTQVQQATAIQQKVLARTQGFIRRYEILREGRDGEYWKTKIKAVVLVQDIGTLLNELKLVERPRNAVKALVLLRETVQNNPAEGGSAYQGVLRALGKKPAVTLIEKPSGYRLDFQDDRGPFELARQLGAGVLVTGTADAYRIEGVSQLGAGFVPYRARAALKAVNVANSQLLAESSREASGIDPVEDISAQKALAAAGELSGQDLAQLLERSLKSGMAVTVNVLSLKGIDQLKKLEDVLRGIGGVQEVILNRFMRGDAEISVYAGSLSGEEMAASVLRAKPFPIDTQSVSQFEVTFQVAE
ncbi:MAG: hypothetical protein ABIG11_05865 [bacterium]